MIVPVCDTFPKVKKMTDTIHIKGTTRPRVCGASPQYECVGDDKPLTLCDKCRAIRFAKTGEEVVQ
jgi:hypothetical protein